MARDRTARKDSLTKNQEIFVQELVKGKTQRAAYLKAYPSKKNWKESSLDVSASKLFKDSKVKERFDKVLQGMRETEESKSLWSREQSIQTLRYVIDKNKTDLDRIEEAAEEELESLAEQIKKQPDKAEYFVQLMLRQRKSRRISSIHNGGIVSAVAELNKMQGFNEETINLNGSVIFEGDGELEE